MTIRLEFCWKPANLYAAAQRMFETTPEVVGREPLRNVDDAAQFLIQRLKRQLDGEPLETVHSDCINIYRGYWTHLLMGSNPRQEGDGLVSRVGAGKLTLTRTLDLEGGLEHFTIERPADRTATMVCHVTFLVDLAK